MLVVDEHEHVPVAEQLVEEDEVDLALLKAVGPERLLEIDMAIRRPSS